MDTTGDPFLQFLAGFSGEVIRFCPGHGGVEDALSSMSFLALCDRLDVTVAAGDDRPTESLCFFGSVHDAAAAPESHVALLPSDFARFEAVGKLARKGTLLFCRDPKSMRVAELQGVPHDRRRFCLDLACHLGLEPFDLPRGAGEGELRLDVGDHAPGDQHGDGLTFLLSGTDDRWRSRERSRRAIQQVITALEPYAVVTTTSLSLAILTARIGRKAILRMDGSVGYSAMWRTRMSAAYPGIAFETDLAREPAMGGGLGGASLARSPDAESTDLALSQRSAIDARRALRRAAQERETLSVKLALLREEFDASVAKAVIASERDSRGNRLLPARAFEERLGDAEKRVTEAGAREMAAVEAASAERERARAAVQRLNEIELQREADAQGFTEIQRREQAATQLVADMRQREQTLIGRCAGLELAAHERKSKDGNRSSALDLARGAEEREISALRATIEEMARAGHLGESRMAQTLMLLNHSESAKEQAEHVASATRSQLDAVLSSASWRATRPFRAGLGVLRRLTGSTRRRRMS